MVYIPSEVKEYHSKTVTTNILGKFLLHIKYEGNEVNQSDEKERYLIKTVQSRQQHGSSKKIK